MKGTARVLDRLASGRSSLPRRGVWPACPLVDRQVLEERPEIAAALPGELAANERQHGLVPGRHVGQHGHLEDPFHVAVERFAGFGVVACGQPLDLTDFLGQISIDPGVEPLQEDLPHDQDRRDGRDGQDDHEPDDESHPNAAETAAGPSPQASGVGYSGGDRDLGHVHGRFGGDRGSGGLLDEAAHILTARRDASPARSYPGANVTGGGRAVRLGLERLPSRKIRGLVAPVWMQRASPSPMTRQNPRPG
jgi:hypothetical protein